MDKFIDKFWAVYLTTLRFGALLSCTLILIFALFTPRFWPEVFFFYFAILGFATRIYLYGLGIVTKDEGIKWFNHGIEFCCGGALLRFMHGSQVLVAALIVSGLAILWIQYNKGPRISIRLNHGRVGLH
jgi:hypothetical protein